MLAQGPTVVAEQDYDGVVGELQPVQGVEYLADLRVHEADAGEVGALEGAELLCFEAVVERFGGEGDGGDVSNVLGRFFGQRDLVQRVEGKVGAGGDVRHMGPIKAHGEEERLVLVLFQEADGFGGDLAVGLLGVGALGLQPAEGRAQPAAGVKLITSASSSCPAHAG